MKIAPPPRPALTPRMAGVIERMARAGHPPLHQLTPEQAKAAYEKGAAVLEVPKPELARAQDIRIPARDGTALPARLYAPSNDVLPVLLYLHGGGFTVGSVATHDILCRVLARDAGIAVVSLDYRLAPAHRFPTAVHDAWDALQHLAGPGASALGLDGTRLAVGGDSAGGTLAAVCAILARDAALKLALQLLIYPGTTARQDTDSHRRFANGPVLTDALVTWFFAQYIDDAQRDDWRFAPLNAEDVDGVAPAWVGLAECDPLVDEGLQYADKLRAAGVPVDLELYRGVVHEFVKMGRAVPEALQAHAHMAAALRAALNA
ncbi:alpha/beta hydrolase [Xenophilus arseniciresistens]|uniref:Alpha/beta hydrolase n=1 Tax=Xenophilus arseniciresistens TaxID=1283306 RepID=A0AAE3T0U5_9BURK|nr:alpha/beta hydrolase [Xenophilus arseniciresistens]MDA7417950.1 alpha/beta hydrolase [Xenophilus arseniciresistens]